MDYRQVRIFANQMYNYAKEGDYRCVYSTKEYYTAGVESPFIATLILQDEVRKQSLISVGKAKEEYLAGNKNAFKEFLNKSRVSIRNQFKANEHEFVQKSRDAFMDKISELYPKTAPMRQAIIEKGAVVMDEVVPKFKGLKKFLLTKCSKKYAKTFL